MREKRVETQEKKFQTHETLGARLFSPKVQEPIIVKDNFHCVAHSRLKRRAAKQWTKKETKL